MNLKGKSGAAAAVLAAVFGLGLFCGGCGETFRPVANPVPQPGGDPQRTRHALVVSSNGCSPGTSNPGAAVDIDVSGDTNVGTFALGGCPVHATSLGGTNYAVNLDYHTVFALTLPADASQPPPFATLADDAKPVFAVPAQGMVFVAESGRAKVAVIQPGSPPIETTEIPVGSSPVALVATPDGTKLYCLNLADNSVSVIFPATNQVVATINLGPGAAPLWGTVSSDGSHVFVVNFGRSNVSVIDTSTDMVINTLPVGAGPNYIVYQASLNRAYVTSPAGNSLSIIDNNRGTVQTVSLEGAPCNAGFPISVTALADGTRAYVADEATNSVCVLNTTSNTFTKSIPVGTAPVFIASDTDSTRVYTANSGSFDVSIIRTSDDTTVKQSDGIHPLTICAGPTPPTTPPSCTPGFTPTFIAMTP